MSSYTDLQATANICSTRRFIAWVDSGGEPIDNTVRFRACLVVNHDYLVEIDAIWDCLEEEGSSMDDSDGEGLTWVNPLSEHESDGHLRVGISFLMPRVLSSVAHNWEELSHGSEGGICMPWTYYVLSKMPNRQHPIFYKEPLRTMEEKNGKMGYPLFGSLLDFDIDG